MGNFFLNVAAHQVVSADPPLGYCAMLLRPSYLLTTIKSVHQAFQKDKSDPEISSFASMLLSEYQFPVMMMVIAPNGTIVNKVNANDFLTNAEQGEDEEE